MARFYGVRLNRELYRRISEISAREERPRSTVIERCVSIYEAMTTPAAGEPVAGVPIAGVSSREERHAIAADSAT